MPSFLIKDYRTGLQNDKYPWLIENDAFETLENLYIYQGRVQKKGGTRLLGRLVNSVTAESIGVRSGGAPDTFMGTLVNIPVASGSLIITDGVTTFTDNGSGGFVITGGSGTVNANTNYETGAYNITFNDINAAAPVTATYNYHQNLPVTGIRTREIININQEETVFFNTTKANVYSDLTEQFTDVTVYKTTGTKFSWTGSGSNYFYSNNYLGALWTTNGTAGYYPSTTTGVGGSGDGIRWYDGDGWCNFNPRLDGGETEFLKGCKFIIPFQSRLVCFHTFEGAAVGSAVPYPTRARWSQNGTPFYDSTLPTATDTGFDIEAWQDDINGKGSFVDAPTSEQITGVAYLKNTLIVTFERSTWRLRYTGNEIEPFVWERINSELGADSGFSLIQFDDGVLALGDKRIVSIDTSNVVPIDDKIPREVYEIKNDNNFHLVYGIRDFPNQLVYWTYPDGGRPFPNKTLVFNYENGAFSKFNQSVTVFGHYQPSQDITWETCDYSWDEADFRWDGNVLNQGFPKIVGGNQGGYIFVMGNNLTTQNDPSIAISGVSAPSGGLVTITTAFDHNLKAGDFIRVSDVQGAIQINDNTYKVGGTPTNNTFTIAFSTTLGTYIAGGQLTVQDNFLAKTKRFNPFLDDQKNIRLSQTSFLLDRTENGEFTVIVSPDSTNLSDETVAKIVRTRPEELSSDYMSKQARAWHPMYTEMRGDVIQYTFKLSDDQMLNPEIVASGFGLNAMNMTVRPWNKLRSFL